jgi:alpha-L-fucosidase
VADALDVQALARMAKDMGAQYVIFTAYHAGMNLMYPSPLWGKVFPRKVSKRDLIGDLAEALKAQGIPLILYVHPDDRHDLTAEEQKELVDKGYSAQANITRDSGKRPKDPTWQATYVRLIDEIGSRYGGRIVGYWEDGGVGDGPKIKAVMLEHTPDAAIWKNGGWSGPPATLIGSERENRQQQWAATVAGNWWASGGKMTRTPRDLYRTTVLWAATQGQVNGGIAWSAGPYLNNTWETGVAEAFKGLGQLMHANGQAIYGTVASTSYVTTPNAQPEWGVATDSADGSTVYLHVFNAPKDRSLQIGKATDGRVFDRATLLNNGKAVKLATTAEGYLLTLPNGVRWNDVDTVVCLSVKK